MDKGHIIDRWRATAEELRLQLHLGSKELTDKFEEQKQEILKWSQDQAQDLNKDASEAATDLQRKLEELQVQAALGRAETKDAFLDQRKKLNDLLTEANEAAIKLMGNSKNSLRELAEKADTQFDQWQTRLDLFRLQVSLGAMEASDQWNEQKKDLKNSIVNLESKLDEAGTKSEQSWDQFKNEISEAWKHVKKAFS